MFTDSIKNSLSTFTKKETKPREIVFTSAAIIFNLIDHKSTALATLLDLVLRTSGIQTALIDVRDTYPKAECYYWVNIGSIENIKKFLSPQLLYHDSTLEALTTSEVLEKSVFIDSKPQETYHFESSCFGYTYNFLKESNIIKENNEYIRILFGTVSINAQIWSEHFTKKEDVIAIAGYHNFLQECHKHYKLGHLKINEIHPLFKEEGVVEKYFELNKSLSHYMLKKTSAIVVNDKRAMYINTLDSEIYVVLRRISISNYLFYHLSEGSYGSIAYSNVSIREGLEHRNLLRLTIT